MRLRYMADTPQKRTKVRQAKTHYANYQVTELAASSSVVYCFQIPSEPVFTSKRASSSSSHRRLH